MTSSTLGYSIQYDAIGVSLGYDAENHLVSIGSNKTYYFDGDGNLVKQTDSSTGAVSYRIGNYYETTYPAGDGYYYVSIHYRLGNMLLATNVMTNNPNYAYLGVNYYATDHLGSVVHMYNERPGGNWYYKNLRYLPFGGFRWTITDAQVGEYRFTSQRRDSYINLYWFNSRWYDPAVGRFVQPDTIVPDVYDPILLDRYAYAKNSPLHWT